MQHTVLACYSKSQKESNRQIERCFQDFREDIYFIFSGVPLLDILGRYAISWSFNWYEPWLADGPAANREVLELVWFGAGGCWHYRFGNSVCHCFQCHGCWRGDGGWVEVMAQKWLFNPIIQIEHPPKAMVYEEICEYFDIFPPI